MTAKEKTRIPGTDFCLRPDARGHFDLVCAVCGRSGNFMLTKLNDPQSDDDGKWTVECTCCYESAAMLEDLH